MKYVVALLAAFCLTVPVLAQSEEPMVVAKFVGEFRLDGLSDEPGWEAAAPLPMVQYEPDPGQPPTQPTEIRIAYDESYVYLSLRAYDADRKGIRANTLYRDRLSGDDHFEILLDTFNDNETGIVFTTTPAGIRRESALYNDANAQGMSGWLNTSFNTFWDVKSVINDQGWFSEIRIPFSSLRFQEVDGKVTMGFTAQRKIARRSERLIFPEVPPSIAWGFLRPSLARDIVFEGIKSHNPVYVTPYVLSGPSRQALSQPGTPGSRFENQMEREIGADLRYGITNSLSLDLTVNTDFAQVEADDQQVNLTRFSLFYPEKRQFFQERASLFEFKTGGESRLFHSRRIGLTDTGNPVRILGGARLSGRIGEWDFGLLNMQTAEEHGLPSENFGVVRLRRRVLNDYSYIGGISTTRLDLGSRYNVAYGLDGLFRLAGDDYLSVAWAQTFYNDMPNFTGLSTLNNGIFDVLAERRNRKGFGYRSGFTWSGRDYLPGVGFFQRYNFSQLQNEFSYTWLPGADSKLLWHTIALDGFAYLQNSDRHVESAEIGPEWRWFRRAGASGAVEAKMQYEDLPFDFPIAKNATVPAGRYSFFRVGANFSPPLTARRQLHLRADAGPFYDGWQMTIGANPTLLVSPHLELSGNYEFHRVVFADRDQRFNAHIARLRIGTALNTQVSTNAFVQYNSAIDAVSANVRFRYNFREGNDLWIVYNEGLNTNRHRFDPALPFSDNRTVLLKYTHTFGL